MTILIAYVELSLSTNRPHEGGRNELVLFFQVCVMVTGCYLGYSLCHHLVVCLSLVVVVVWLFICISVLGLSHLSVF